MALTLKDSEPLSLPEYRARMEYLAQMLMEEMIAGGNDDAIDRKRLIITANLMQRLSPEDLAVVLARGDPYLG